MGKESTELAMPPRVSQGPLGHMQRGPTATVRGFLCAPKPRLYFLPHSKLFSHSGKPGECCPGSPGLYLRMRSQMALRAYGSTPAVGSSKMTARDPPTKAMATDSFLFMPPERVCTREWRLLESSRSSIILRTVREASGLLGLACTCSQHLWGASHSSSPRGTRVSWQSGQPSYSQATEGSYASPISQVLKKSWWSWCWGDPSWEGNLLPQKAQMGAKEVGGCLLVHLLADLLLCHALEL